MWILHQTARIGKQSYGFICLWWEQASKIRRTSLYFGYFHFQVIGKSSSPQHLFPNRSWFFAFNGFSGQPRAKRRYHGLVNMSGDWTWKIHSPVKKVVSVWTLLEERNKLQPKTHVGMQKTKTGDGKVKSPLNVRRCVARRSWVLLFISFSPFSVCALAGKCFIFFRFAVAASCVSLEDWIWVGCGRTRKRHPFLIFVQHLEKQLFSTVYFPCPVPTHIH